MSSNAGVPSYEAYKKVRITLEEFERPGFRRITHLAVWTKSAGRVGKMNKLNPYIQISGCRSCGNPNLKRILSFGSTLLADALLTEAQLEKPEFIVPLDKFIIPIPKPIVV